MDKKTADEYHTCMGFDGFIMYDPYPPHMLDVWRRVWYSGEPYQSAYVEHQMTRYWLNGPQSPVHTEGDPPRGSYKPRITVDCPDSGEPAEVSSTAVRKLRRMTYESGEMGEGYLKYFVPNMAPANWKVVLNNATQKKLNPTFTAILTRPNTWHNFGRCIMGGGDLQNVVGQIDYAVQTRGAPEGDWKTAPWVDPWCPAAAAMIARKCMVTVDFYSNAQEESCLDNNMKSWAWVRWNDWVCGNEKKLQTVSFEVDQPKGNPELDETTKWEHIGGVYPFNLREITISATPIFAARRVVYKEWVQFYLPTTVSHKVPNGYYVPAQQSFEGVDATEFKGIRRVFNPLPLKIPCPMGTWLTCEKKPDSGIVDENEICTYPVALLGSTAAQWRSDVSSYYDEIGSRSNPITQVYSYINANNNNPLESKVPGLNGTTCFPCRTAAGKFHFGESLNHLSNEHETTKVLDFYCRGGYHPPETCPFNKVVPFDPVTGVARSTSCVCDNGYRPDGDSCVVCDPGTYCNVLDAYDKSGDNWKVNDKRPIDCPSGNYSLGMASNCPVCNTEPASCSDRQRLSACMTVPGADSKTRTKYQRRDARCVSCLSCMSDDPTIGEPCLGATQKSLFT